MPSEKTSMATGLAVITDDWTIVWSNQTLDLTSKKGLKHTLLCGDPHIITDGEPPMDFPSPTCTFVLTDATVVVADAPVANQPLTDIRVFTTDGHHYPLGTSQAFDDVTGTLFLQQVDGEFFGVVSRDVGTGNVVHVRFQDIL